MKELNELIEACKGSVSIKVNYHRGVYKSVSTYIGGLSEEEKDGLTVDIYSKMVLTDTIICIAFYPNNPVGFCVVWHYDLEQAIQECLDAVKTYRKNQ